MNIISIGNKKFQIPQTWEEFKSGDYLRVLPLLFAATDKMALQLDLLFTLVKISNKTKLGIDDTQYAALFKLVEWIGETPCTYNVLTQFKFKGKTYHFPAARLEFSSMVEFAFAEIHMMSLSRGDETALNQLVATLCRPAKPKYILFLERWGLFGLEHTGDKRITFDTAAVTENAKLFADLPNPIKLAALHFYIGCKKYLVENYAVFELKSAKVEDEFLTEDQEEESQSIYTWLDVCRDVAKSGVYGPFQKTLFTNVHTFLFNLAKEKEADRKSKTK